MVNYIKKVIEWLAIGVYGAVFSVWLLMITVFGLITGFLNLFLMRVSGVSRPYDWDVVWIIVIAMLILFVLFLYTLAFLFGGGIMHQFYILLGAAFLVWFHNRAGWFLALLLVIFLYFIFQGVN